jgi:hypothetical protein
LPKFLLVCGTGRIIIGADNLQQAQNKAKELEQKLGKEVAVEPMGVGFNARQIEGV